jgi:8-oxo-dGTP diphosphatase
MKEFGLKLENIEYSPRPGAYAFIVKDHYILLIDIDGKIYLPGGGLEKNETLTEGLKRELLEETGYEVIIHEQVVEASQYLYSNFHKTYFKKSGTFFYCSLGHKTQEATDHNHSLVWVPLNEASQVLKQEFQIWALEYYIKKNY